MQRLCKMGVIARRAEYEYAHAYFRQLEADHLLGCDV